MLSYLSSTPSPAAWKALRDGELDFVAGSAHATLQAFQDWKGAKLLAALAQRTYWLLIMRADLNIARGDLQAVKGKRIGAAPGPDLTFRPPAGGGRIGPGAGQH